MTHDQIMDKYIDDLEKIAQNSAFNSAARIPMTTRKYSGQAQASTRMGINSDDLSVTLADVYGPNAIDDSIAQSVNKARAVSRGIRLGDKVYITNNLDYIRDLEYEFGDLMFTTSARLWQEDVNRAVSDIN